MQLILADIATDVGSVIGAILTVGIPVLLLIVVAAKGKLQLAGGVVAFYIVFAVLRIAGVGVVAGVIYLALFVLLVIGGVRLATPGSAWAQRFYGPEKNARAAERFGSGRSRRLAI